MEHFDVAILGAGPACLSLAYDLKAAGKSVAVVEENLFGGTCPNAGCDPKKILFSAEQARSQVAQLVGKGFAKNSVPQVVWSDLMAYKKTYTDPVSKEQIAGFDASGIKHFHGHGQLISANEIAVTVQQENVLDNDTQSMVEKKQCFTAEQIVLATGQRARLLDIPGQEYFLTSTDFLALEKLPAKMIFLGAGYISFELAAIANACGAEVTILHHNDTPLRGFDQDLAQHLVQELTKSGVTFVFNENIQSVTKNDGELLTVTTDKASYETNSVVCATGRIANVENLGLEELGIEASGRGITVDDHLKTSQKNIYAMGDCIAKKEPKMTPVASFEGRYLKQLLLGETTEKIKYPQVPTSVFTLPTLAQVGVSSSEAKKDPASYKVEWFDMSQWYNYFRTNDPVAFAKIIYNKDSGEIVGAATLNQKADEWINIMTLVINLGVKKEQLQNLIMAYPSVGSDLQYYY
ncbi:dihydrolipoyl dehydrogenase family protein [Enterococcus dispar]|uniref:dihydrolipoyl dehydrogenase family protein n=1 Tax=Enterococcus dispar TaxID=44009 RepID=UPI00189D5063|nr:NAD(P)/FAD-dependent oxidoreductase [Enterococcus dispar]MDT2705981.1 NAD(P)/FAD-dependent oxidoreductase [Enterococcus dispar]